MNRLNQTLLCVLAVALMGCKQDAQPDATPCGYELSWGHFQDETFVSFADGNATEITEGFQGFRYIYSALRLQGLTEDTARVSFQISVNGQEPYVQSNGNVMLEQEDGGATYARDVLVFFNDIPIAQLVGRNASILARTTSGTCNGDHGVSVVLADDEQCVQLEDGSLDCDAGCPADGGLDCPDAGL